MSPLRRSLDRRPIGRRRVHCHRRLAIASSGLHQAVGDPVRWIRA